MSRILTPQQKIERSIVTDFRRDIWNKFVMGYERYDMIKPGDKIAVCISGGKDSMLLAKCMQHLQKYQGMDIGLEFIVMNPGYSDANRQRIIDNAALMGIPIKMFETKVFDIALGHHFDDVIETILMSMVYGGQIQTMMPKLHSRNYAGMELIRPLYMVKEADIIRWVEQNDLHFIRCACRFTESYEGLEKKGEVSKRQEMKELIAKFRATNPNIENNIFKSVYNVNLRTVIQYEYKGKKYNFMDTYDDYDPSVQADDDDDEGIE